MTKCEEHKIKNKASLNLELCGEEFEIESNETEAEKIKITVEKSQSCNFVLVGEKIKYTVKITNDSCVEIEDVVFKDELDDCVEFVAGSFTVDGKHVTPVIRDGVLKYTIPKLEPCQTVVITFEVKVEDCGSPCGKKDGDDKGDDGDDKEGD